MRNIWGEEEGIVFSIVLCGFVYIGKDLNSLVVNVFKGLEEIVW